MERKLTFRSEKNLPHTNNSENKLKKLLEKILYVDT